jgi:hypothetical protein
VSDARKIRVLCDALGSPVTIDHWSKAKTIKSITVRDRKYRFNRKEELIAVYEPSVWGKRER